MSQLLWDGYYYLFPPNIDRYIVLEYDKENNEIIEYLSDIEPQLSHPSKLVVVKEKTCELATKVLKKTTKVCEYVGVKFFEVVATIYFDYYNNNLRRLPYRQDYYNMPHYYLNNQPHNRLEREEESNIKLEPIIKSLPPSPPPSPPPSSSPLSPPPSPPPSPPSPSLQTSLQISSPPTSLQFIEYVEDNKVAWVEEEIFTHANWELEYKEPDAQKSFGEILREKMEKLDLE